jgi:hypothetical protein
MKYFRRLIAGFPLWWLEFDHKSCNVGFVFDEMGSDEFPPRTSIFSQIHILPTALPHL